MRIKKLGNGCRFGRGYVVSEHRRIGVSNRSELGQQPSCRVGGISSDSRTAAWATKQRQGKRPQSSPRSSRNNDAESNPLSVLHEFYLAFLCE